MIIRIKYQEHKFFKYQPVKDRDYTPLENDFLRNTLIALDYLYFHDIMLVTYNKGTFKEDKKNIIDLLINHAPEPITIEKSASNHYLPSSNTILFNDEDGVIFRLDYKKKFVHGNIGRNSPVSLLAHELIHCYHELFEPDAYLSRKGDKTTLGQKQIENGKDLSYPNKEELQTISLSNQINERLGEEKRQNYGRSYYKTAGVLTTELHKGKNN